MLEAYDEFSGREKEELHRLLTEWLLSKNSKDRYDARFLIRQRRIRELAPAVAAAIEKLRQVPGPEAREEVELLLLTQEELS
jgi:hypothetical protein